jgi:hypothetical protein
MNIQIDEALNFPFKDRDWFRKIGPFLVALIVIELISFALGGFNSIASLFTGSGGSAQLNGGSNELIPQEVLGLATIFGAGIVGMLLELAGRIVKFYFGGYTLATTKSVMSGMDELPESSNAREVFKFGLVELLTNLVYIGVPSIILAGTAFFSIMLIGGSLTDPTVPEEVAPILIIVGVVVSILYLLYILVFGFIIRPAIIFNYLRKDSFNALFSIAEIASISKVGAVRFLILGLVVFAITLVIGIISIVGACLCLGWLIPPVLSVFTAIVFAKLYGDLYVELLAEV